MKTNEHDFYSEIANWSFEDIDYTSEVITNWIYEDEIKKRVKENTKILDLGTAAGEKVLKNFPNCAEILGTDFSDEMIETANKNLLQSGRKNISFRVMDNLKMDTSENYFDLVTARHTIIDPLQIYKTLKKGGQLVIRGVDKLDCWSLKRMFKRGQAYHDVKPISLIDYEAIMDAGANFASSPARILIDFLDPLIVAKNVAITDKNRYVTIDDFVDELRDGKKGVNGFGAIGKRNVIIL